MASALSTFADFVASTGPAYLTSAEDVVNEAVKNNYLLRRFLRGKGPLRLVLQTVAGSHSRALRVEARVKRLPKAGKERLVSHPGLVRDLLKAVKSRREQCP